MRGLRKAVALACAAMVFAAAGCGEDDAKEAATPPAARALSTTTCSPVTYGGPGRPQYLIVSSSAFQGEFEEHGIQAAQAMKMILGERGWRAGPYSVGLQICDEASKETGVSSPRKCQRIARAAARNDGVLAVIGPLFSSCAAEMLPILNRAPGGPLLAVAPGPTYLGLTRSGPGTAAGEPDRYYPTGRRSFARMLSPDDTQGAAGALYAQRRGVRRVFVLNDGIPYGVGVAAAFGAAAERLGIEVAGSARWNGKARDYRGLVERVRAAGADGVYLGGYVQNNGPRLIRDLRVALGRDAEIIGPDGFNNQPPIVEGAGARAEGFTASIGVLPTRALPPAGRRFAADFERRFGARPCCIAVHAAQAARIVLDAIAASGGSRDRVLEGVLGARVRGGLIGDFAFDRHGDITLNTIALYRIRDGRLRFDTAITPAPDLLARR